MSALHWSRNICLLALLGVGGLAACGGPEKPKDALQAEMQGLPKWALGNCQESLKNDKLLCGSGSVQGMSNLGLARSAAEGRARTALARTLQVRVKAMLKDYQAATQASPVSGAAQDTASEQHIEDVSKQITDVTLSGTRVEETFVSDTGTFWSLVVLDAESFKSALKEKKELDEATRQAILDRADQSFADLDANTAP
jgi:hypothetical protein